MQSKQPEFQISNYAYYKNENLIKQMKFNARNLSHFFISDNLFFAT